jgi:hypothetical protein
MVAKMPFRPITGPDEFSKVFPTTGGKTVKNKGCVLHF